MAQLEDMGCYYKDWNFEIGFGGFPGHYPRSAGPALLAFG